MAKITNADLFAQDATDRGPLMAEALAPLVTGVNKDGSPFNPDADDTSTAGSLSANGATVTQQVYGGFASASISFTTGLVGTTQFEVSYDGGTTFYPIQMADVGVGATASNTTVYANKSYEGALPAGCTHIRARVSAYTSGASTARVAISPAEYEPAISISAGNVNATPIKNTTGGLNIFRTLSVVATGANIKATAGMLYALQVTNVGAAVRFLKLYNKATAPVVGTDTPLITIAVPAGQSIVFGSADIGATFGLGIGVAATTGVADADTTAPGANEVIVNILYA